MSRIAWFGALAVGLVLGPSWQGQQAWQQTCIDRCYTEAPADTELQRQEIVSLEREAGRAIQLNNGTYFQRVYSEDFAGTLSHGQQINKDQWIATIQSPLVKRESFNVSDIKVHIFQDTAVATCLWSSRFKMNGQQLSSQIRAIHVYINTRNGWHVVSGQTTNLPPDVQQQL
ncbi:MAG TPA: nuclear transport factor 2 family protein [Candidatus Acidoferrum sp.]